MGDTDEISAAALAHPDASASELRDILRSAGRVSITVADVERVLGSRPSRVGVAAGIDALGVATSTAITRGLVPPMYRWQAEALAAWELQGHTGVVEAVTGTGKTLIGVVATLDELDRGGQVCVLVPTGELLRQWRSVLADVAPAGTRVGLLGAGHRDSLGQCDVLVAIVNSAAAAAESVDLHPRRPGGLLVGDECHRYGSERNRLALVERFPRRLGLSATFERADGAHATRLEPFFGPMCFSMGYRRAIDDGVIARFVVALVGVRLTDGEYAVYEELTEIMGTARGILVRRFGVPTEPIGAFLEAVGRLVRHSDDDAAAVARSYLKAMQDRRHLLADTPSKRQALRELVPALTLADRCIVFTQSIAAAEDAAATLRSEGLSAEAIHSQLRPHDRHEALARFADGLLQIVAAPQVLDEGIDVPAADLAVILASSRSRRQMVQRMGRVLRRKPDGRRARFVVVAAEDTIEDPRRGAHEGFLEEVTEVADAVAWFPHSIPASEVIDFLGKAIAPQPT